jgi:hypothetical protein
MKRKHLLLLIFILLVFCEQKIYSQEQKLRDFIGWEFLKWKTNKNDADKIVKEKGIEIRNEYSEPAYENITRFEYEEMNTILYFDSLKQFYAVKQQKDFSVAQDEQAKVFFEKTKKILLQKFGKADQEKDDKEKKVITIIWNLKYANVFLTYDYKYKIVDEMGCCSYTVDIDTFPVIN